MHNKINHEYIGRTGNVIVIPSEDGLTVADHYEILLNRSTDIGGLTTVIDEPIIRATIVDKDNTATGRIIIGTRVVHCVECSDASEPLRVSTVRADLRKWLDRMLRRAVIIPREEV